MSQVGQIASLLTRSIRSVEQTSPQTEATCPNCKGTGWYLKELEGQGRKAYPCDCQLSSRVARRIPKLFHKARLTDFKAATLDRVMAFFAKPNCPGLLLLGPTGVGKTHLAAAIGRALIETNQQILFRDMARIYLDLRECMRRNESEEVLISELATVPWLILDDFGSGALSEFERRYALDLLNRRLNAGRKTIVTTNLELDAISEKMDERIASRLSEFDQIGASSAKDRRAQKGA